jgi:anti-sigma factor RsiW
MSPEPVPPCGIPPEDIHALVLGELDPDREADLRAHVAQCADCRSAHEAALALDEALHALPSLACPPQLRVRLQSIASPGRPRSPLRLAALVPLAAAAAVLAILTIPRGMLPPPPTPIAPAPTTASSPDLEDAQRQVELALALLDAAGRETAARAGEKVIRHGVVAPARRIGLALLAASRRATGPGSGPDPTPGRPL